jgi:interferon gamma-inducible protein 30
MTALKFFLLSLFVLSCLTDDRVRIEMYTESLCPDCIQFLSTSAVTAFNTKDFALIADIYLYPYGNARESQSGSKWVFTCQHGDNECVGNLMESCALNLTGKQNGLAFVLCVEANLDNYSQDFTQAGTYCAGLFGVNMNDVNDCMQGDLGNQIQHDIAVQTENLQPSHQYVPWVVVNGAHDTNVENQVLSDMLTYVCQSYQGSVKIDACSQKFLPL